MLLMNFAHLIVDLVVVVDVVVKVEMEERSELKGISMCAEWKEVKGFCVLELKQPCLFIY